MKSVIEKFGKLYYQLSTIKIQNVEQCDEWLNFYRWYHDELKKYVIERNSAQDLTSYSKQDTWTYLKLLCNVENGCPGFYLKAIDMFNMDRVPFLGRAILKDNRETSMYLYANSFDYFLKQNIYSIPIEKEHPSSSREIDIWAMTDYLGEISIGRKFMELYGNVVDNILDCHKNDSPTEDVLLGLRSGILNRQSTENLTGILCEAKEAAVKMLIK